MPAMERIGTHDLRMDTTPCAGFYHVTLRDADDGDVIIVNEDDLIPLRDKLNEVIAKVDCPTPPVSKPKDSPDLEAELRIVVKAHGQEIAQFAIGVSGRDNFNEKIKRALSAGLSNGDYDKIRAAARQARVPIID